MSCPRDGQLDVRRTALPFWLDVPFGRPGPGPVRGRGGGGPPFPLLWCPVPSVAVLLAGLAVVDPTLTLADGLGFCLPPPVASPPLGAVVFGVHVSNGTPCCGGGQAISSDFFGSSERPLEAPPNERKVT
jgi:hypothetical protein